MYPPFLRIREPPFYRAVFGFEGRKRGGRGSSFGSDSSITSGLSKADRELISGTPRKKDFFYLVREHEKDYYKSAFTSNAARLAAAKDDAKYSNIMVNTDLPKLVGTPRQVAYAEQIRSRRLTEQADAIARELRRPTVTKEQKKAILKQANQRGMNVKSISDIVNQTLRRKASFYFTETSAKKIIER